MKLTIKIMASIFAATIMLPLLQPSAQAATLHIKTAQDLQNINNNLAGDYILDNDINGGSATFTPLGSLAHKFTGTLNGNGHTISNLTINSRLNEQGEGLFGAIGITGNVINLELKDVNIKLSANSSTTAGDLVGYNEGTIVNVSCINGSITSVDKSAPDHIGGFAGSNHGDIEKSYANITVELAPKNENYSYAIGGFVGSNSNSINQCASIGSIKIGDTSLSIGGFAGENSGNIANSYTNSSVTTPGYDGVGGFVGYHKISANTIRNSYASGKINATCPTLHTLPCHIGGFAGYAEGLPNGFSANYWDTDSSGKSGFGIGNATSQISGVTGKTTVQMHQRSTFKDWDMTAAKPDALWDIIENHTYPFLKQQRVVLSGKILSPDGSPITAATVRLAVNGITLPMSDEISADKNFFAYILPRSELVSGNALLFYLEDSSIPANTIYIPGNSSADITDLKIYLNRVTLISPTAFNNSSLFKLAAGSLTSGILYQTKSDGSFKILTPKLDVDVSNKLSLTGTIAGTISAIDIAQHVFLITPPAAAHTQYINGTDLSKYHASMP